MHPLRRLRVRPDQHRVASAHGDEVADQRRRRQRHRTRQRHRFGERGHPMQVRIDGDHRIEQVG
jgi:hypothetical protein